MCLGSLAGFPLSLSDLTCALGSASSLQYNHRTVSLFERPDSGCLFRVLPSSVLKRQGDLVRDGDRVKLAIVDDSHEDYHLSLTDKT